MTYEIGTRIRYFREAKKMTQKQLADRIGVTNSRVCNWEQGTNRPDVDKLADICKVLSVSPSELLDVRLDINEFTNYERQLIFAYRTRADMQKAVRLLLGLDEFF
ncbi:MAG: helix-turn-helix domain-containing protein [Oscillospiraceae bacterium]|nr:helix-turn-helix domain-containing protein [Oscillospiraceae bacterium]MCL2279979.1 helix-turn-helix domain-containing protein [Oscillospiraceae bacterium]